MIRGPIPLGFLVRFALVLFWGAATWGQAVGNAVGDNAAGSNVAAATQGGPSSQGNQGTATGTAASMGLRVLKAPTPHCSQEAWKQGVLGSIVLDVVVSAQGEVLEPKYISGPPMLAQCAIDGVKQWKFTPYMRGGKPMDVKTRLEVAFGPSGSTDAVVATGHEGGQSGQESHGVVAVPSMDVAGKLVKGALPVYPQEAKLHGVQGDVVLRIVVSEQGDVVAVKYVEGPQQLARAAVDAVKQWKYTPFLVGGQPVAVRSDVVVSFAIGVNAEDAGTSRKASENKYRKHEADCQKLFKAGQYLDAEGECITSAELAGKLPKPFALLRFQADGYAGETLLHERKFSEALGYFQSQVKIGEVELEPDDGDLGNAYHHLAMAYQATGDTQSALAYFERAEVTLEKARVQMDNIFLKNEYADNLQTALRQHIALLEAVGQADAAANVQKRADWLAGEIRSGATPSVTTPAGEAGVGAKVDGKP
jgi:TonB family protein